MHTITAANASKPALQGSPMASCCFTHFFAIATALAWPPTEEKDNDRYCPGPVKPALHWTHLRDSTISNLGFQIPLRALPIGAALALTGEAALALLVGSALALPFGGALALPLALSESRSCNMEEMSSMDSFTLIRGFFAFEFNGNFGGCSCCCCCSC